MELDNFSKDGSDMVSDVINTTVFMSIAYGIIWKICPMLSKVKEEFRASFADNILNFFYVPLLCYFAVASVTNLWAWGLHGRWLATCYESYLFLLLYVSKNTMRTFSSLMLGDKKETIVLIHIHHVISVACYGFALYSSRFHFYACLDGVCEVSVIFLNNKQIWRNMGWSKQNKLYILNAHCLAITWMLTRVTLFPVWMYLWCKDHYMYPEIVERESYFEAIVYPTTTFVLWLMSISWFIPIVSELGRLIGLSPGKKENKSA
mmetsp:Transcript_5130/g.9441  ORF Transcript_5130/g.9441 Transcript_5130/m.9441 type:complete len:262 (-) Transcript_5130:298-1083(-)